MTDVWNGAVFVHAVVSVLSHCCVVSLDWISVIHFGLILKTSLLEIRIGTTPTPPSHVKFLWVFLRNASFCAIQSKLVCHGAVCSVYHV